MSLVNNSANNFKDFLDAIKPYLNYQIYDLSGQGVEANNYSTNEKVIGTWIDGKPLYQKTLVCKTPTVSTDGTVAHAFYETGVPNIDYGFIKEANLYDEGQIAHAYFYLPRHTDSGRKMQATIVDIERSISEGYTTCTVELNCNAVAFNNMYVNVTICYTKTTDTAVASGEKIVGQWIDGKPLYEKTIDFGALPNATTKSVSHGISNLGFVVKIFGISKNPTSGVSRPIPFVLSDGSNGVDITVDNTNVDITTSVNRTNMTQTYITLRYTKSS